MTTGLWVVAALLAYGAYGLTKVDRTLSRLSEALLGTTNAYSPFFPVFSREDILKGRAELRRECEAENDAWEAAKSHEGQPDLLQYVDEHIHRQVTREISFERLCRMIDANFAVFSGRSKYRDVLDDYEAFVSGSSSRFVDETKRRKAEARGATSGSGTSLPEEGGSRNAS